MEKINWGDVAIKIAIGLFIALQVGMGAYAMRSMSEPEKTDFILQQYQEQQQE